MPKSAVARIITSSSCCDVPADVAAVLGKIEDRIADDLAGTVIGDVAAAVAGMKFDVLLREQSVGDAQIVAGAVAAERDDMGVLAEEQHVGDGASFAGSDELPLQFVRRGVGDQPQIHHPAGFLVCFT